MRFLLLLLVFLVGCQTSSNSGPVPGHDFIGDVVSIIKPQLTSDFEHNIDLIREWIHDNAQHNMLIPDDDRGADPQYVAMVELAYYHGIGVKPNLFCGYKAGLLYNVMVRLGISVHIINIMDDNMTPLGLGHILNEVLNPYSGKWEIVDSDMNQYYTNNNQRLGVLDLVFGDTSVVLICTPAISGCASGDNILSSEGFDLSFLLQNFYKAVIVSPTMEFYINPLKYDLNNKIAYYDYKTILEFYAFSNYTFYFQKP